MTYTIVFASDHAGVGLKQALLNHAAKAGHHCLDIGAHDAMSVDYPDYGFAAARMVASGEADRAVLVCGSGIGISIAANRVAGVRAALCHGGLEARLSRQHNDANALALGARIVGEAAALDALDAFLNTDFEGGRHASRIEKLG